MTVPRLVVVVLLAACASRATATRAVAADVRAAIAPPLEALPDGATFAWVAPERLLSRLTPEDLGASESRLMSSLRDDVSMVLRSHAWRETGATAAEYELTLAHVERRPPPSASRASGRSPSPLPPCRPRGANQPATSCTETPAPAHARPAADIAGTWVVYVIRRRADGAQRVMTFPLYAPLETADLNLAPSTLALLLQR